MTQSVSSQNTKTHPSRYNSQIILLRARIRARTHSRTLVPTTPAFCHRQQNSSSLPASNYSRPQCVCVGPAADVVVVTLLVVAVLVVASVVDRVVAPLELLGWPDPALNVDPMSPQRMLEKTTCVVGFSLMMSSGLPSVAEQGPLLPESSQFM